MTTFHEKKFVSLLNLKNLFDYCVHIVSLPQYDIGNMYQCPQIFEALTV